MNVENPVVTPLARVQRPFLWLSLAVLVVALGLGTAVALEQTNTKPDDQPRSKIRPGKTHELPTEFAQRRRPTQPSETKFGQSYRAVMVQVPTPRAGPAGDFGENPAIAKQIRSIKAMSDDDENRAAATTKLRELLDQEFARRHDRQAAEIVKVQERLEKLTRKHGKRGENKDKIVQRRIDSLLDQPDELAWDPSQPTGTTRNVLTFHDPFDNRVINGPGSNIQWTNPQVGVLPSTTNPVPRTKAAPKTAERFNTPPRLPNFPAGGYRTFEPKRPQPALNRNRMESTSTQPSQSRRLGSSGSEFDPFAIGPGSMPNLNELFQLARDADRARLAIKLTETNLDALKAKNRAGEPVTGQEMEMQKITLERYRRDAELFRKQIEAMRHQLDAQLRYAKEALEYAVALSNTRKMSLEAGVGSQTSMLEAKRQVLDAEKRVNHTEHLLENFLDAVSEVVDIVVEFEKVEDEVERREEFETTEEETEGGEEDTTGPTPER